MIHHVSTPARDPRHVAGVLAELMGGQCMAFGPLEGAFMATSGDAHGTMIEVYPDHRTLDIPEPGSPSGEGPVVFGQNQAPPAAWPFHVLLSVALEADQVEHIGAREGWRTKTFGRGVPGQKPFFHVIEFWVENRLMIEVATPAMAQEYMDFLGKGRMAAVSDPETLRHLRQRHAKAPA
jgi:hypothetical protein